MKLTRNARKVVALALSAALVLGGTGISSKSASAAKKVTLKLNKKTAKVTVGKKVTLKVKKKNVKKAKITWKSSKKSVATVSKKGVVTGKKAGKAKISATIKYKAKGSKKTKKKTLKCTVTVAKKATVATKAPTTTKKPSTDTPSTTAPSTDTPSTTAPSTIAPSTDTPSTTAPSTDTPSTTAPSTDTPSTDTPSTDTPFTLPSFKDDVEIPTSIELKKGETTEIPAAVDMGSLSDYTPVFDGWAYNSTSVSALEGITCEYDAVKGCFTIKVKSSSQASMDDTPRVYLGLKFEKDGEEYKKDDEVYKIKLADCEITKIDADTSAPAVTVTKTDIPAYISLSAGNAVDITAPVTVTSGTKDITGYSMVWEFGIHYAGEDTDLGNAAYAFDTTSGKWTVTPKSDFTLDYSKSPYLDLAFKLKKDNSYFQMDDEDYMYTCASIPIVKSGSKLTFNTAWASSDDHGNNYMQYGSHTVAVNSTEFSGLTAGKEICVYVSGGCNLLITGDASTTDGAIFASWANAGVSYYTLTADQISALQSNGLYVVAQDSGVTVDIIIVD